MPSQQGWDNYFREEWDEEPAIFLSPELQEAIKNDPRFTAPPMGPIGDYIFSGGLHHVIPQSFATSYLVHSEEDVKILREVVAAHGESHPTVIVYPKCEKIQAVDENLTIGGNHVSLENLQLENPTIANLVIDWFGTTTGIANIVTYPQYSLHVYFCRSKPM